jgi:hypothetical protein
LDAWPVVQGREAAILLPTNKSPANADLVQGSLACTRQSAPRNRKNVAAASALAVRELLNVNR